MVSSLTIRDYAGDCEDVAALGRNVWTAIYGSTMWFPLWDAAFLRWQIGGGALAPALYDGDRLVGTFFSLPHQLRIKSQTLSVGLASWCTVDPAYRAGRSALRLIGALRERHAAHDLAFSLGVISGDRASLAHQFWSQYAQTFPQNLRFLFRFGLWVKVLNPARVAAAGVSPWEQLGVRVAGPLLSGIPFRPAAGVRPYATGDLQRCADLLTASTARCDWALQWPLARLAAQLDSAVSQTFVLESGGSVQAFVNIHRLSFQGRSPVRAAMVDLWAADVARGNGPMRLIGHLCRALRLDGVDLVLAMRARGMPTLALLANGFVPQPAHHHVVALFLRNDVGLTQPKTWHLIMR
jgi:hypothetical protein